MEEPTRSEDCTRLVTMRFRRLLPAFHPPGILLGGSIMTLVLALLGSTRLIVAYTAVIVLCLLAATVALWRRLRLISEEDRLLGIPLELANDRQVLELHWSLSASLRNILANPDPIYHDLALQRARQLNTEFDQIAKGHIVFTGTERWRMAYERLLRSPGLHLYRSVAVVRTPHYWQDEPGKQSMSVNLMARREQALSIERIAIVADSLWPATERLPIEPLQTWLAQQHAGGLSVRLVRLSELAREPDLVLDMGIYGTRALGIQEQDEQGRTVRFTLSFDFPEVLAAEQRWQRLSLLAAPLGKLLDQTDRCT